MWGILSRGQQKAKALTQGDTPLKILATAAPESPIGDALGVLAAEATASD